MYHISVNLAIGQLKEIFGGTKAINEAQKIVSTFFLTLKFYVILCNDQFVTICL